ncbi:hypothetical protein CDD82_7020 [Ophiocordyceps australis]|uniref:Uncharacterized protein n=1 Tax=Ophiocordyceps australis TaxID=1399860 RepID=A0A2C5XXL7_9HYPO|nr:hypothetical protein CDD82_7020 [Ophiocordyceps australis]
MKAATTLVLFAAGVLASPAYIRSPLATRQTSCKDILDQALGADSKLTEGLRKEFCNDDPDLTLGKSVTDAIDEFCAGQDVKQIACGQGTSPSPPAKPTPEPGSTTCKEILDQALGADSKETESLRQEFCNDDPDFTLGQSVKDAIDEFCVGQDVKQS